LCRGINDFKKGYRHRINIVKDEKVDLLTDSQEYFGHEKESLLSVVECIWD
jgi:hypothetical protein